MRTVIGTSFATVTCRPGKFRRGSAQSKSSNREFATDAAASSNIVVVSGGARGVDQVAMAGALSAEGRGVGVTAEGVARMSVESDVRDRIVDGKLVLVSAVSPSVRFTTWNAMARNRLIYTLCDYVLVVSTATEKGGTWSGAIEDLKKRWVPLFVRSGVDVPAGNDALLSKGGIALAESEIPEGDGLRGVLEQRAEGWADLGSAQAELPFPES